MYRYASTCPPGLVGSFSAWGQDDPEELPLADSFGCPEKLSLDPGEEPVPRLDLIARVRQEIAAGIYDTPEKWEAALDGLLERLDLA
jgi:hypothetical protein